MSLVFYLLRHAKAEPGRLSKQDSERPLAEKGREDAARLGEWLKEQGAHFDHIWCSNAVRTQQTLDQLDLPNQKIAVLEPKLYHAPSYVMLDVLRQTPADAKKMLMVGHNPGISQLAGELAMHTDNDVAQQISAGYPTCTCAIYRFHCETWQEAEPANAEMISAWWA